MPACTRSPAGGEFLLNTLGKLWLAGQSIDWPAYYSGETRRRLPLPGYPFERSRYWLEPRARVPGLAPREVREEPEPRKKLALVEWEAAATAQTLRRRPRLSTTHVAPTTVLEREIAAIWEQLLGIGDLGIYDSFFELGGNSLVAVQLISRVRETFSAEVPSAPFSSRPPYLISDPQ